MTVYYSHYGLPNTPPDIIDEAPTGTVAYTTPVSFRVVDDRGFAVQATLDVTVTYDPGGGDVVVDAIINGVIQSGFTGTITPNLLGGFDVSFTKDGVDGWGDYDWTVDVYVEDDLEDSTTEQWSFTSAILATIVRAQAFARRVVEVEFDRAVKVRASDNLVAPPVDRYTPVEWDGNANDAANPENFVFSRPSEGNLVEDGEAVELTATWAEEHPDHGEESAGYIWSTHIWVHVDYDMTARADYTIAVSNVVVSSLPMPETEFDFIGFVVSQVPRQSLRLIETLPAVVRRLDDEGTGDLAKLFTAIQEVFDRLTEDVDVFFADLCDIDRARYEFLDTILYDLGNPFAGKLALTINEKRKLISLLVGMYREKGTCVGVVNAVRVFTGVELLGCSNAWGDCWILGTGTYPTSYGGSELGIDTVLGPGTAEERWSFWLYHATPGSITADQLEKIGIIVDYMKPAATHYLGVTAP